jgi:hypothetical protein
MSFETVPFSRNKHKHPSKYIIVAMKWPQQNANLIGQRGSRESAPDWRKIIDLEKAKHSFQTPG